MAVVDLLNSAPEQTPDQAFPAITRALSEQAAKLSRSEISDDSWLVARHCLLDWFGIMLAGASDECARIVTQQVLQQAGTAQSSVFSLILKDADDKPLQRLNVPAAQAALANGTASHALDFDDVNYALHGHATVAIAPAVLALAQARDLTLEDALVAFVAGVEFACAAATYVGGKHYSAGWHATSTLGSLGAAAACARLLQLDATATAHAVGLAATQSSGLKSMFGTMAKPFHAGRAARTGVESALLVEGGFTTRDDSIECPQGIIDVMHGAREWPTNAGNETGDGALHSHMVNTLFKYHASCFETHATIEACLTLADTLSLRTEQSLDDVEAVVINVRPQTFKICNLLNPRTGLESKFSLVQTATMALFGIDTGSFQNFNTDNCTDPTIVGLRQRVQVVADASLKSAQARVEIKLRHCDGRTVNHEQFHDASIPATDLDRQQIRLIEKFKKLCSAAINASEGATTPGPDADEICNAIVFADPAAVSVNELADTVLGNGSAPA